MRLLSLIVVSCAGYLYPKEYSKHILESTFRSQFKAFHFSFFLVEFIFKKII